MATSSIFKNFIIEGDEQVNTFVDALEASYKNGPYRSSGKVRICSGPEELKEFMEWQEKMKKERQNK